MITEMTSDRELAEYLAGKSILITGGTGSFGHVIVSRLVRLEPRRIVVFSRDEKKQHDMQQEFAEYAGNTEFVIGNVRDYARVHEIMRGIDIVYHAAALKQVPHCELNPFEALQTNAIGAENIRRAAIAAGVDTVIAISTDKAVKPVNVMGLTKAIQERVMLSASNHDVGTRFLCVRYGNVLGSRGSVVPFFQKCIAEGKPLQITGRYMTRFMLTLDEAINLVFKATLDGENGQLMVKKMPACHVVDLARVMVRAATGRDDYPVEEIGARPGEKIHEVLVSEEEMRRVVETQTHYVIHPHGSLNRPVLLRDVTEYSSDKADMLNDEAILAMLRSEKWVGEAHGAWAGTTRKRDLARSS